MHEGTGSRLSFANDTKLAGGSEEEAAWLERQRSGAAASSSANGPSGKVPLLLPLFFKCFAELQRRVVLKR